MKVVEQEFSFCTDCWKRLEFIGHYCLYCGSPLELLGLERCEDCCPQLIQGRSIFRYNDIIQKIVHHFKYNNKWQFGKLMAYYMSQFGDYRDVDYVLPVPSSLRRLLWRGYDHMSIVARAFCKFLGKKLNITSLKKVRHTLHQANFDFEGRYDNVMQSFQLKNSTNLRGKSILIIDDVLTSGATVSACADVLQKAQCSKIQFLTFARAARPMFEKGRR